MTNKDKLLCLFESQGLDISTYRAQKESIVFNEKRNEYLTKNDSHVKESLKKKCNTYADLCALEDSITTAEKKVYENYPSNPFLYNYQNKFLNTLTVSECVLKVNGENVALGDINAKRYHNCNEILEGIKEDWFQENREYISKRKQFALDYVDKEYYQKHNKLFLANSSIFTRVISIIVLIGIALMKVDPFEHMLCEEGISPSFSEYVLLLLFFGGYTLCDFLLAMGDREKVLDKISYKYNRIFEANDNMRKRITPKTIVSRAKLTKVENYRQMADTIDNEYLSINHTAPFVQKYNIIKGVYNLLLIATIITCFVAFGFLKTIIVVLFIWLVRTISK